MRIITHIIVSLFLVLAIAYTTMRTVESEKISQIKDRISVILPSIKYMSIREGNQSLTRNKSEIFLCTKDKEGSYYPMNMLIHVTLHEIAHVLCSKFDTTSLHSKEFYLIYNKLAAKAHEEGIYNKNIPKVKDYCKHNK
jgi:hypothetical protein